MLNYQNHLTIRLKHQLGFNLLWNHHTHEVHYTGSNCHGSHNLDSMVAAHMHFFAGYYLWDGLRWQLHITRWDPATDPHLAEVRYSNCGHCQPELMARGAV